MLRHGGKERRGCVHWGHQAALLGGLPFSALLWGLISQTITSTPCTPPVLLAPTELCSLLSRHKSSSQKPRPYQPKALLTACAKTQPREMKPSFMWAQGSFQGLGRRALTRLIIAARGTPCVVCWLQSPSELNWFHLSELKLTCTDSQRYLNLLNSTVQPRLSKLQLSKTPWYSKQGQVSWHPLSTLKIPSVIRDLIYMNIFHIPNGFYIIEAECQ